MENFRKAMWSKDVARIYADRRQWHQDTALQSATDAIGVETPARGTSVLDQERKQWLLAVPISSKENPRLDPTSPPLWPFQHCAKMI